MKDKELNILINTLKGDVKMKDILKKWWFYAIIAIVIAIITIVTILCYRNYDEKMKQEAESQLFGNTTISTNEWLEYFESQEKENKSDSYTLFSVKEYKNQSLDYLMSYKNKEISEEHLKESLELLYKSILIDYENSDNAEYLYLSYKIDNIIYNINNNEVEKYIDSNIKSLQE